MDQYFVLGFIKVAKELVDLELGADRGDYPEKRQHFIEGKSKRNTRLFDEESNRTMAGEYHDDGY